MFMHSLRYVGIQVPRLTRPRFICCTGELRFYFYSRLERARDLSADFRRVARDNVMRGEVPLHDRPTKRKHKEGLFFPHALVYHGLVIISSRFRSQAPTCNTVTYYSRRDNSRIVAVYCLSHFGFCFTNILEIRNKF